MSFVVIVIDTDVASKILTRQLRGALAARLAGTSLAITFVTLGELVKWTLVRKWGSRRIEALEHPVTRAVVLPYSERVAGRWGVLQARGPLRGRPGPANDTWIAACCFGV